LKDEDLNRKGEATGDQFGANPPKETEPEETSSKQPQDRLDLRWRGEISSNTGEVKGVRVAAGDDDGEDLILFRLT
jgi:hypothetical protein